MNERMSESIRKIIQESEEPLALGWSVLRKARNANHAHLTEKEIFMAGAGFLFDALIHAFVKDEEPTAEDLALITKFHQELTEFHHHFNLKLK